MGRRAKNKQAPPNPLEPKRFLPSSKRKADALDDSAPVVKSVKKVRQTEGGAAKPRRRDSGKAKGKAKGKETKAVSKGKGKSAPAADDDEEDWEDMDDGGEEVDLKVLGKYVYDMLSCICVSSTLCNRHMFEASDEEDAGAYSGGEEASEQDDEE